MAFNEDNFFYKNYRSRRDLWLFSFEFFHLKSLKCSKTLTTYWHLRVFLTFYTNGLIPLEPNLMAVAWRTKNIWRNSAEVHRTFIVVLPRNKHTPAVHLQYCLFFSSRVLSFYPTPSAPGLLLAGTCATPRQEFRTISYTVILGWLIIRKIIFCTWFVVTAWELEHYLWYDIVALWAYIY